MRDDEDLCARVSDLEQRVSALEAGGALEGSAAPKRSDPDDSVGYIAYQGSLTTPKGPIDWTIQYDAAATTRLPAESVTEVLAALGSPVRLALVRTLLAGPAGTKELETAAGLSSPGQLYHHLRALTAAHVVETYGRGTYRIATQRVIPVHVLLLAAGDIADEIR